MDGQGDCYIPLKLCVWASIMTNLEMEYVKRWFDRTEFPSFILQKHAQLVHFGSEKTHN